MTPIVAIVGRPNVGKSTLFNRLVGRSCAIVHDAPGVTRDRHYADAFLHGREVLLIDTGGFDPDTDDPMGQGIARHVQAAITEADVVICVFDGTLMPTAPDREAVALLRRSGKRVVYAANKIDNEARAAGIADLYDLGLPELVAVSALHGRGTAELATRVVTGLHPPDPDRSTDDPEGAPRVALIGRPNAGKSSLLNRLAGTERSLVDHRPGTTRDPVDSRVIYRGNPYVVVDTAGIRRRSKVDRGIEAVSVMRAIRAVERAEIVVLVCDATEGLAEQDARLLGLCAERGRAIVVALSKTDLLDRDQIRAAESDAQRALHFAPWVPLVPVSSHTGSGLGRLMQQVSRAAGEYRLRVPTARLNRFFETVLARHPPPTSGGRAPRIFYVTQAQSAPPVFVAVCSAPSHVRESYRRYLHNQLREAFGFRSIPLKVQYRKRSQRER